jgi:aryl-alcohol dehydrogenase-like predicted oxidoreductase
VGLSKVSASLIRRAHAVYPLTCVEEEWSLWSRDIEESVVPVCKELGIGILAYSPLGSGFLTGAIDKAALAGLAKNDFRIVGMPRLQVRAALAVML